MYGSEYTDADGQSNSLPIAIISSLAYTLDKDLYWDKIPKDTAEKVVSRGILYLLIFAQYISVCNGN
jgi:auxin efflux carrier family protein